MIQEKAYIEGIYKHIKTLEARYKKNIDSHLFFPLADAYVKADMLDQAEVVLREGLSTHPKYCAAKALLGEVLFKKGDIRDAQNQLEEVIEVVPDNIMAHKLLIEIYKRTGFHDRYERELMTFKMIFQDERPYSGRDQIEATKSEVRIERTKPDQKRDIETIEAEDLTGSLQRSVEETDSDQIKASGEEGKGAIITATLAELYFSQGFIEKSIEIYNELLVQKPDQKKWAKRLAEIQEVHKNIKMNSEVISDGIIHHRSGDKKEKILFTLEKWLDNCQRLKDNKK